MEKNFKIAIIDDNFDCIDTLRTSLLKFTDSASVVGSARTHELAKQLVLNEHPDLLFLDMEMPEITGLQFLREIKSLLSWPMHVVFYTAYEKYMLEAFRESAFDYLLKPFTQGTSGDNESLLCGSNFQQNPCQPSGNLISNTP